MTLREEILEIKRRIKWFAAEQKADKLKRSTVSDVAMSSLWAQISDRSARISAHLNFYNNRKGKWKDRNGNVILHKVKECPYTYRKCEEELEKEFPLRVGA